MANVWIQGGEYTIPHVEAVMDIIPYQVLLGQDLGIRRYLLDLAEHQVEERKKDEAAVLLTRRQANKETQQLDDDDQRTKNSDD